LATPGITVEPLVCVHRGQLPWGQLESSVPVPVLTPTQLVVRLASLPPWLSGDQVAQLTRQAMGRLRPAASSDRRAAPKQGGSGR
jgi:hypothetical protein